MAIFALLKPASYYNVVCVWHTQPGGGPILTNLIHDIDNLRFICGEIESVYAVSSSITRGFKVEDSATLTLRFEDGALGSVVVSDTTPAPWSYELTSGENRAEARYKLSNERALARFASQTPIFNRRRWWRIRQIENCCHLCYLDKTMMHVCYNIDLKEHKLF